MVSPRAREAAANAVKAFLADIASIYLGRVYDHKKDAWGRKAWGIVLEHFQSRCAYCNTLEINLPKGVRMTMEHLIEENQWQCGLHHPGNTVPACSSCNGSRDKSLDGSRLTWEQHLKNIGAAKNYSPATIEKRRKRIQDFLDTSAYPTITEDEMRYIKTTAQALYQDILKRCTAGTRGFVSIHREVAVSITKPTPRKKKTVEKMPYGNRKPRAAKPS